MQSLEYGTGVPNPDLYVTMGHLTRTALAVCQGEAQVSTDDFPPAPYYPEESEIEPGNHGTKGRNAQMAFQGAFYAPVYGPAVSESNFRRDGTIGHSVMRLNHDVRRAYYEYVTPERFQDVFLRGRLWRAMFDPQVPEFAQLGAHLEAAGDVLTPETEWLAPFIEEARVAHYAPRGLLSHEPAHIDLCRHINSVLEIGHRELGMRGAGNMERLIDTVRSDLQHTALLSTGELNPASLGMVDPENMARFRREFFYVDANAGTISLNLSTIAQLIESIDPQAPYYVRRGCPALFLRTPYRGTEQPIFTAMIDTFKRMYRDTGALTRPRARRMEAIG